MAPIFNYTTGLYEETWEEQVARIQKEQALPVIKVVVEFTIGGSDKGCNFEFTTDGDIYVSEGTLDKLDEVMSALVDDANNTGG